MSNPNATLNSSPSPTTPSPFQAKRKKPLMVIGPNLSSSPSTPDTAKKLYGHEVVGKKVRVYWPLDKSWYEGCVISFDQMLGKHLVQYDDADEEFVNLSEEKIEWIDEPTKKFRRLRRILVVDDEEEIKVLEHMESGGDDLEDEDWGKGAEKEEVEDEDCLEDEELEEEDDGSGKGGSSKKVESRKRKFSSGGKLELSTGKKSKSYGEP